jgi:hypothetical protein
MLGLRRLLLATVPLVGGSLASQGGIKLGDREYKNRLDGYNQLDLLLGAA